MSEPEIESVSSQIKAWISRIKNLSLEIPNDDLDDSDLGQEDSGDHSLVKN